MFHLFIISFFFSSLPANDINTLCDRAQFFLFNRHLNRTYLDSAYAILAHCRNLDPRNERTLYLWSRIHTQMGEDARNTAEKIRLFERAKVIAETLQTINPQNPAGYLWWAIPQGRIGQMRGVLNSLFMVPDLKKMFNKTLELDSSYAAAYDALGVLYYELPSFAGGDLKKAEKFLIKGLRVDPNYTVIRLDLARVYIKQHRYEDAKRELHNILKTQKPTYPADYFLEDKPAAEKLLKDLTKENRHP